MSFELKLELDSIRFISFLAICSIRFNCRIKSFDSNLFRFGFYSVIAFPFQSTDIDTETAQENKRTTDTATGRPEPKIRTGSDRISCAVMFGKHNLGLNWSFQVQVCVLLATDGFDESRTVQLFVYLRAGSELPKAASKQLKTNPKSFCSVLFCSAPICSDLTVILTLTLILICPS